MCVEDLRWLSCLVWQRRVGPAAGAALTAEQRFFSMYLRLIFPLMKLNYCV